VRDGFEAGGVPGGVRVRGPVDVPELDLGCGPVGVQVERKGELEQLLPLVPVDVEGEVDRRRPGGQGDLLDHAGGTKRPGDPHPDQGRGVDEDLDGLRLRQLGDVAGVVLVDVPGVPLGGRVPVELEQVAAPVHGDQLPVGCEVAHRRKQPVGVDGDGDERIPQHDAVRPAFDRRSRRRRPGAPPGGGNRDEPGAVARPADSAERWDPAQRIRPGVQRERLLPRAGELRHRRLDQRAQGAGDLRVVAFGLAVHPGDRRAGQDVVELLEQHQAPGFLERVVGVLGASSHGDDGRPQLRLPQQVLAAAVAALGAGLGCVGAAVEFEVELPRPDGRLWILGLRGLEEAARGGQLDPGRPLE